METNSHKNRPAWHRPAGRIARIFGIYYYDLYYGEKNLVSLLETEIPNSHTMVRQATPQDLDTIFHRSGAAKRAQLEHNLDIGSTCYAAIHQNTIAGYLWVNHQVLDLVGMHLAELAPKISLMHSVFVFPENRRKRIFQFLFRSVCKELFGAGILSITCFVDKANSWPIEAFNREGFRFHNASVLKLPLIKPVVFCRALA